jgi:hypothetical protein
MRNMFYFAIMFSLVFLFSISSAQIDTLIKGVKLPAKQGSSDQTIIASGLKEALTVGTGNAVTSVSKTDAYFGNKMIKIIMPEKIQTATEYLCYK